MCLKAACAACLLSQVYRWFLGVYNVSVGVGLAGYALLVLELFAASSSARPPLPGGTAIVMLWYGLYFGVLGRDAAEVAADRMVRHCFLGPAGCPCMRMMRHRVHQSSMARPTE
jgi:hypothetical protein